MDDKQETFTYQYSAKQQEEVRQIRQKYLPREEDPMEQLRRLDRSASRPGTIAALAVGILSALVLGVGMCCTMVWGDTLFLPGVFIGIAGLAGIAAAYPLYTHITRKRREARAPEILRLTSALLK